MTEHGTVHSGDLLGPARAAPPPAGPVGNGAAAGTPSPPALPADEFRRHEPVPRSARTTVECPECGSTATVDLARRDATDFCAACDYPLFWSRPDVVRGADDTSEWSLRRLPGTEGRARAATIPCPHCAEPNVATSVTCVRCGRSLLPEPAVVVAPAPVVIAAPPAGPEPYRVPAWQWWVAAAVLLAVIIVILVVGSL